MLAEAASQFSLAYSRVVTEGNEDSAAKPRGLLRIVGALLVASAVASWPAAYLGPTWLGTTIAAIFCVTLISLCWVVIRSVARFLFNLLRGRNDFFYCYPEAAESVLFLLASGVAFWITASFFMNG
jgi:hypothetical protein